MLSNQEIQRYQQICDEAVKGPWSWTDVGDSGGGITDPIDVDACLRCDRQVFLSEKGCFEPILRLDSDSSISIEDARFIVESRSALPRVLNEFVILERKYKALKNAVLEAIATIDDPKLNYYKSAKGAANVLRRVKEDMQLK